MFKKFLKNYNTTVDSPLKYKIGTYNITTIRVIPLKLNYIKSYYSH